jgi:hypothetical protein
MIQRSVWLCMLNVSHMERPQIFISFYQKMDEKFNSIALGIL